MLKHNLPSRISPKKIIDGNAFLEGLIASDRFSRLSDSVIAMDNYLIHDFKKNTDSALMVRDINYVNDIFSWLSLALGFISELIILSSIFCFLLIFNFNVSISLFLFGLIIAFLIKFFLKEKIQGWSRENNRIKKVYYRTLIDLIYGLKEIVLFNKEKFFVNKFKKNYKHNLDLSLKIRIVELLPRPLIEMIFITALVITVFFFVQKFKDLNTFLPYLGVYVFSALAIDFDLI